MAYVVCVPYVQVFDWTVVIDMTVAPGKKADGGGIYLYFSFVWKDGDEELGMIAAQFDVRGFDLEVSRRRRQQLLLLLLLLSGCWNNTSIGLTLLLHVESAIGVFCSK